VLINIFSFCDAPLLGILSSVSSLCLHCCNTSTLWASLLEHYRRRSPPRAFTVISSSPKQSVILSFFSTRILVNNGILFIPRRFSSIIQAPSHYVHGMPLERKRYRASSIPIEELLHYIATFFQLHPRHIHLKIFAASNEQLIEVSIDEEVLNTVMYTNDVALCAICKSYYDLHNTACGGHCIHL
jgi:hypothetical protein